MQVGDRAPAQLACLKATGAEHGRPSYLLRLQRCGTQLSLRSPEPSVLAQSGPAVRAKPSSISTTSSPCAIFLSLSSFYPPQIILDRIPGLNLSLRTQPSLAVVLRLFSVTCRPSTHQRPSKILTTPAWTRLRRTKPSSNFDPLSFPGPFQSWRAIFLAEGAGRGACSRRIPYSPLDASRILPPPSRNQV